MAIENNWVYDKTTIGKFVKNADNALKVVKTASAVGASVLWRAGEATPVGKALAVGALAYTAYDASKNDGVNSFFKNLFGVKDSPYTTKKALPPKTGVVPTVADPLNQAVEGINKNTEVYNKFMDELNQSQASNNEAIANINAKLGNSFSESPLLQNQIYLKDSLDNISSRILEQSQTIASVLQVFDSHMTLLNSSLLTIAKNVQVSTQANLIIADKDNYGDADFFYSFVPTSQYWHDVDVATQTIEMEEHGSLEFLFVLPSASYAPSEIELVDRMQGESTRADIRKAIEAFRVAHVPSNVRARLGLTLVASTAQTAENTKAQTDFYTKSVESLKSKELTGAVPASAYGATTEVATANALAKLANTLAPAMDNVSTGIRDLAPDIAKMAETAVSAKVVHDHAQTVRDIHDLDGAIVARMAPMEATAVKDATRARTQTDVNSDDYSEDLPTFPDLFPLLNFAGRGDVFNQHQKVEPSQVFSAKTGMGA